MIPGTSLAQTVRDNCGFIMGKLNLVIIPNMFYLNEVNVRLRKSNFKSMFVLKMVKG